MSVEIKKYKSRIYCIKSKQKLNQPIEEVWNFFTNPKNLNQLTPKDMNFKILSGKSDSFYEGKIISYSVNPFKFYNIKWVTEITNIKQNNYFIDEQRFGPYKMWHHEHTFIKNKDNSTTVYDKVTYKLPYGLTGRLVHKLFIKKRLIEIFIFRQKRIKQIFTDYI